MRRNGGRAQLSDFVETLNISESRARELAQEAAGNNSYPNRVFKSTREDVYHLRF